MTWTGLDDNGRPVTAPDGPTLAARRDLRNERIRLQRQDVLAEAEARAEGHPVVFADDGGRRITHR